MNRKTVSTLFFGGLLAALSGCYAEATVPGPAVEGEVTVEAPPPPPPPQVEVVAAAPGPDYYWVAGYHRWWRGRYVWVRGHYERRPYMGAHWYPAHWEARARGRVWVEGYWR
jgi:hypothetical protein